MDNATKATRSQALIDSIHELIALESDVSGAIASMCSIARTDVMVPVTPVAFMPGTITGGSIMVGLGHEYYVERNPRQAQDILQRRITDLSHQIKVLAEDTLSTPAPKVEAKTSTAQTQPPAETKGWWNKGFLSGGRDKPNPGRAKPKDEHRTRKSSQQAVDDAKVPTHINLNNSQGQERVTEFEDSDEAPIMEIREWIDDSGKQTSVDVTDLGKVLRATPKAVAAPSTPAKGAGGTVVAMPAPAKAEATTSGQPVHNSLDSAFDRLEAQETASAEQAANPALGAQWKRGFLGGGAKQPALRSGAVGSGGRQSNQAARLVKSIPKGQPTAAQHGRDTCNQASRVESSTPKNVAGFSPEGSDYHAFHGTVAEKPVNTDTVPIMATNSSVPTLGPRVSRFKARRQGLQ